MGWWLWMGLALAGSDLAVEVARAHLMVGDADEARTQAAEVLRADGADRAALDVYLQASGSLGLGHQAVVEAKAFPVEPAPWGEKPAELFALVEAMDDKGALALTEEIRTTWPEHPELLAGLWAKNATKKVVKARKGLLTLPSGASDAYALRALRLHLSVGHTDPATVDRVASLAPVAPAGLDDVGAHERARAVFAGEGFDGLTYDQVITVAVRAHAMFFDAGRPGDAATMWASTGLHSDDAVAHAHWALARVAGGDPQAVDLGLIARPSVHDAALSDHERIRHHAGLLFSARAVADDSDTQLAWADLVTGTVLTGIAPSGKVDERLSNARRGQLAPTIDVARKAVDTAADAAALQAAEGQARWAMTSGAEAAGRTAKQQDLYAGSLAELWLAAAVRAQALDDDDLLLRYGVLAAALGAEHNDLERWLGDALLQAEHPRAAFAWLAVARARGHEVDEALKQTYSGLGDALQVATEVAGAPGSKTVDVATAAPRGRRAPLVRGSAPAVGVGTVAPAWSVDTGAGVVSSSSMKGRVVVLSFWRSDCSACLDQLPTFGSLARRLRATGRDVVLVAVSTDEEEGPYQDVHRIGQRWGQLARDPATAETFGLRRVPSTWVIDRSGMVTYFVDHRISADELELVLLQTYLD